MTKKKKTGIILCVPILIITVFSIMIAANASSEENRDSRIANLPAVAFSLMYGQDFNLQNVRAHTPVLISSFSPDCDHCQRHAAGLYEYRNELVNISIVMITRADSIATRKFAEQFKLNTMANVIFLQDKQDLFYKTFHLSSIPSMVIYNRHHKLVKTITGEVDTRYLIQLLTQQ